MSIWYENVSELARKPAEFWPHRRMSTAAKANALTRLVAYVTAALLLYTRDPWILLAGAAAIVLVAVLYRGGSRSAARAMAAAGGDRTWSTPENPFANVLVNEYGKPLKPPPASADDMKEDIRANFNKGLFMELEDVYERGNSQRQFYSMPNGGGPPDTKAFRDFLYGGAKNCKLNPSQCTGFD